MLSNSLNRICHLLSVGTVACVLSACGGGSSGGGGTAAAVKGDAAHGQELYAQCAGCHEMQQNTVGPMHCGVVGRAAGSLPDFDYSEAMKASGIVWDPQQLDEFLTAPIAYVNGTKMGFAGFSEPSDRADLIAYLQQANNDPAVCPR